MSAGTVFTEIDLDSTRWDMKQKQILYDAKTMAVNVETAWKNLGQKSDIIYDAMRQSAINAFERIKVDAKSSAAEITRAHEAMNAKIKVANEQQFGVQTSLIDKLKANWMAASAGIIATFYAVKKFFDLAELGGQIKSIEESFKALSRNAGISGDALIRKLKEVTNQTVESSDLMKKANRLIVEGFSAEQIIHIGEAARTAARLMGTDVTTAYESVADAIVNLRQRGLKTAGFVIDLNEAYQKHAERLGIAKDSLNDYGKQMALVAAVHEKNIEMLSKMGKLEDTQYENIQKQKAAWKELKEEIAKATSTLWDYTTAFLTMIFHQREMPEWVKGRAGYREKMQGVFFAEEEHGVGTGRGAGFVGPTVKEQQQMMESLEITKQTMQLRKQMLGIGYQTVDSKNAELEIDRKLAILALQKFGNTGGLQALTNKVYNSKKAELELDERIRIQELQTTSAIKEGLIDISEIAGPTYEQRLAMTIRTYDREQAIKDMIQNEVLQTAKLLGNLDMEQEAQRKILQSNIDQGKILKENEAGEKALLNLLQQRAIAEKEIQEIQTHGAGNLTLLSTQLDVQKQFRANQVSMGWMRSGQAGLADLQDEITLRKESLKIDQDVYDQMSVTTHSLDQQEQQWNKILDTEKQIKVLEASRGQYLAEYGKALEGLEGGLKRYVAEAGTLYTQLSDMTYNMAKGMEGAFSNFFQSIFDNTKSWQEKMQGLFKGLADSFIKALSDMAAKALVTNLFGGKTTGGTGWLGSIIGLVGGLFGGGGITGSISNFSGTTSSFAETAWTPGADYWNFEAGRFQHGGQFWVNKPRQILVGEGTEPEFVSITPKSKFSENQSRPNQSISVGPINIQMQKGQTNPAILKKDIETAVIEVIKRHM